MSGLRWEAWITSAEQVEEARHQAMRLAEGVGLDPVAQIGAALVAGELAGDLAGQAAGGSFEIRLLDDGEGLQIVVTGWADGAPPAVNRMDRLRRIPTRSELTSTPGQGTTILTQWMCDDPRDPAQVTAYVSEVASGVSAALAAKEAEMGGLMAELEDTNRGLIALHAELESAREAESRIAAIVRWSDDAIYSLSPDLTIVSWNAGAEHLLGYKEPEIVGRKVHDLIPEDVAEEFDDAVTRLRRYDRAERYDTWRRRKDGTVVEVTVTLSAIRDSSGGVTGYAAVLKDLTERRIAEEDLSVARASQEVFAERDRIAADLHDLVIQRLFASGMALQSAINLADPESEVTERVGRVIDDLDATIAEIRSTIYSLGRRSKLGQAIGLRSQVLEIVSQAREALGFQPRLRFVGPVDASVPAEAGDNLVAVVREALSNVARHAGASSVDVVIEGGPLVRLLVIDNGRGIGQPGRRSGLENMAARARKLGGTFGIEPAEGGGTRLEWLVPGTEGAGSPL